MGGWAPNRHECAADPEAKPKVQGCLQFAGELVKLRSLSRWKLVKTRDPAGSADFHLLLGKGVPNENGLHADLR